MNQPLLERLRAPGPKRILSLDGGGIRGCASLGFLERIETIVRERTRNPDAVLSDYFDLIGGTSTGAIIAAMLSLGHPVSYVTKKYLELGPEVFSVRSFWARIPWIGPKLFTAWSVRPLEKFAKEVFLEKTTLGSPAIRTGLCVVTKRADTFSTWPYINHPGAKYYKHNADTALWKLVRASSAAPTYFRPMRLDVGTPESQQFGTFIDGGVSMANNPALQLFLVATLGGFPFHWKTGADDLLIVSVGTGRWRMSLQDAEIVTPWNLHWAHNVPELLMQDATHQNELLLQYLSRSPTAREIDREVGTLEHDLLGGAERLTYLRYNAELSEDALSEHGIPFEPKQLASWRDMAAGKNARVLYEIGQTFAKNDVKTEHFPAVFDGAPTTIPPAPVPVVGSSATA